MRTDRKLSCRRIGLLAATVLMGWTAANGQPSAKPAGVEVKLSEYAIEMPHALPAGPTTFRVSNGGKKMHTFKLQGPGIPDGQSVSVKPRESGSLEVTLQPGDYKVYCPIGSHAIKGMTMDLKVTAKPN